MTTTPDQKVATEPWRNVALPVAERVELLLARMTLEEKIAQLGSRWLGNDLQSSLTPPAPPALAANGASAPAETSAPAASGATAPAETSAPAASGATAPAETSAPAASGATAPAEDQAAPGLNVAPMQEVFAAAPSPSLDVAARHGLGHLTRIYGSAPVTPQEGAAELIRQQHVVMNNRLRIPAIVHEECLTGFTTYGATVYPAAIAWGATFDAELIERMAAAIGHDMAKLGVHQGLSPVLDVVRDYRWGRVEETMGEDPFLVATLGSAYVRGLQGEGVIATLKHFAGYSASRAGRNHGPVSMGRRELIDIVLPPFEAAVTVAKVGSVMNSYSDVDGVPAGADSWLLTEVLRDTWNFEGTVVSDYWAVPFLATMHRVAADLPAAGALALSAGVDVELPDTVGFTGFHDEALVDRAARRVLTQKVELGLLDPGWTPENSIREADLDLDAHRELARELAEKSVVLLDAGTALPLATADLKRVAVVGPCADDPRTLMGCYAFPNHVLPRHPGLGLGVEVPTPLDALRAELDGVEVVFERGCAVLNHDLSGFDSAVEAARGSDLCIAMVGDLAGLFGGGSSGEGCDADDLRLPGVQADLLEALLETGTPVVVVVVSGRPYALGDVHPRLAGLVQAFMPGEEGAGAIAGVLSGRVQPSGKLPVQIPRRPGGQPGTYLQPPLGAEATGISTVDVTPLFPFGHGTCYTTFVVDDLRLSSSEIPTDGVFTASVQVRNSGERAGVEVVQLYLRDVVASVARPVRQLTGFARVELAAGESARVEFQVHADRTAFTGRDLVRIVEPGEVEVLIGTSSVDLPCSGVVRLTGDVRVVGSDRRLDTPVRVDG